MSSVSQSETKMTAAEYLEWERNQVERHEFLDGEVFLQAGGTRRHSLIGVNVAGELRAALHGHDCEVHGSDMRICVEATGLYAYPDVSVASPPFEGESDDAINNPTVIGEVLSPSTADYDRGGKFGHYRQIPSLKEYLVIYQDQARIEQHQRTDDNLWLLREISGIDQVLQLTSLGIELPLSALYEKIDFD